MGAPSFVFVVLSFHMTTFHFEQYFYDGYDEDTAEEIADTMNEIEGKSGCDPCEHRLEVKSV